MRRRELIQLVSGVAIAAPFVARAQGKTYRIGVLVLSDEDGRIFVKQLSAGLRDLGWSEGRNFSIELRSAESRPDLLPGLAAELVQLKPDVIVAAFTPCAMAAKQATRDIPIVMAAAGDPIGTGLVTSLAKPGGNITGLSNMGAETAGKLVELFRDMLPSLTRVAILAHKDDAFTRSLREQVSAAAHNLGIEAVSAGLFSANDLEPAFAGMVQERANAVVVASIFFAKPAADLAIRHRLPSASVLRSFVNAGGLMSYGADIPAPLSQQRHLRAQDPSGSEAGRPAGRTADEIRAGGESQDRQGHRACHLRFLPAARGRSDGVNDHRVGISIAMVRISAFMALPLTRISAESVKRPAGSLPARSSRKVASLPSAIWPASSTRPSASVTM
jgi:putative ABC transport system substrate-binding protein